jgi:hypothetical protein
VTRYPRYPGFRVTRYLRSRVIKHLGAQEKYWQERPKEVRFLGAWLGHWQDAQVLMKYWLEGPKEVKTHICLRAV